MYLLKNTLHSSYKDFKWLVTLDEGRAWKSHDKTVTSKKHVAFISRIDIYYKLQGPLNKVYDERFRF